MSTGKITDEMKRILKIVRVLKSTKIGGFKDPDEIFKGIEMLLSALSFKDESARERFRRCVVECCDVEAQNIDEAAEILTYAIADYYGFEE